MLSVLIFNIIALKTQEGLSFIKNMCFNVEFSCSKYYFMGLASAVYKKELL